MKDTAPWSALGRRTDRVMIRVVSPRGASRSPPPGQWVYLGESVTDVVRLTATCGPDRRVSVGRLLARAVGEVRSEVSRAIALLAERQESDVLWHASELAHRSRGGDILRLVAYVRVVELLSDNTGGGGEDLTVFVEDDWCRKTMSTHFAGVEFVSVADAFLRLAWIRMRLLFRGGAARARGLGAVLYEKYYFRSVRHADTTRPDRRVWNYLFVEDRAFADPGHVRDVYMPGLSALTREAGKPLRRFTNVLMRLRCYRAVRSVEHDVEIMIRHLRWGNIWTALTARFRVERKAEATALGISLKHLLAREEWKELGSFGFSQKLLWYRCCRTFLNTCCSSKDVLFFWWENQPWNRLLCLARERSLENAPRMVGYQHATVTRNQLNFFADEVTRNRWALPDTILTSSSKTRDLLVEHGYDPACTLLAGSMRHGENVASKLKEERVSDGRLKVSVYLPTDVALSAEIVNVLGSHNDLWENKQVELLIHRHPDVSFEQMHVRFDEFQSLHEGMHQVADCPREVDALICCNTTVSLEGVLMGMTVICYLPEGSLWMDPGAEAFPERVIVCGADTLCDVVLSLRDSFGAPSHVVLEETRDQVFPVPYDNVWRRVIEGGEGAACVV